MSTTIISVAGFDIHVRTEKEGDDNVIGEVIRGDCYNLRQLKASGFEPRTILSVGGHIGTFEVLAHSLWPGAKFISVEPNPRSFELLKLNAPFSNAYNAAVHYGDASNLCLTDGPNATGGGFTITKERYDEHEPNKDFYPIVSENVRALTLEELFDLEEVNVIDLAKFDCEGGELLAFEHMEDATAAKIRRVVGEYHTPNGFEWFKELAEKKFPHLRFYGGNEHHIGPFFSEPR